MGIPEKRFIDPAFYTKKQDGMKMSTQIPQNVQEKLQRFEQLRSQLQMIMAQKSEAEAKKKEMEAAVEALGKREEGDVFKRVGDLLFKVKDVDSLNNEMKDELETLTVRLNSMSKQEENMKNMYEQLGNELNEALKGYQ